MVEPTMSPAGRTLTKLLKKPDVMRLLNCRTEHKLKNLIRAGVIPPPIVLSPRDHQWREDELMAALDRLSQQRPAPTGSNGAA